MRVTATKEFTWDMAHMLSGHEGLCQNLHGHTYKMEVEVEHLQGGLIAMGPSEGMVIDFKHLKEVVKSEIVDPLDHALMVWENGNPAEQAIAQVAIEHGMKVAAVPYRPTVENMCREFFGVLKTLLPEKGVKVRRVRVWETPTSFAEVRE